MHVFCLQCNTPGGWLTDLCFAGWQYKRTGRYESHGTLICALLLADLML